MRALRRVSGNQSTRRNLLGYRRPWRTSMTSRMKSSKNVVACRVGAPKTNHRRLKLVLKAEVGDDEASFERALNGHPDWKGRASEVARLTAKLRKIAGATARAQVQNVIYIRFAQASGANCYCQIPTSSSQTDIDRLQKERSAEKADLLKEISQHQKEVLIPSSAHVDTF